MKCSPQVISLINYHKISPHQVMYETQIARRATSYGTRKEEIYIINQIYS